MERARIKAFLDKQEVKLQKAFARFISDVRSDKLLKQLAGLIEQRNYPAALKIVNDHIVALSNVVPRTFTDVASAQVKQIAMNVARRSAVSISFDPSEPRAAQLMRASKLRFIREFTNTQRDATRQALATALDRGWGTTRTVRAFKDSIGLTAQQVRAVESYRVALENGSKDALNRALRDRRFDSTVARVIDENDVLSSAQIERMVGRYTDKMLAARAETIARTETTRTMSEAHEEATRQVIEQAGIEGSTLRRTWVAIADDRTRDSHAAMDGQTVGLDESFISGDGNELMYPGDPSAPPEEIIACRCQVVISFADDATNEEAA